MRSTFNKLFNGWDVLGAELVDRVVDFFVCNVVGRLFVAILFLSLFVWPAMLIGPRIGLFQEPMPWYAWLANLIVADLTIAVCGCLVWLAGVAIIAVFHLFKWVIRGF
jgi:hypothetical protein